MKFYGLELKGNFWVQRVPDITDTPWTSDDIGRLVYNEADDILYYGGNSDWTQSTQSRHTFNVGQKIIFTAPSSGGFVLPNDWNISSDIDDCVPIITNVSSEVGATGGNWTLDNIMVAGGSHKHDIVNATAGAIDASSNIFQSIASDTHNHETSYDGSHVHTFDGSWRFPHVLFTVGEYSP